MAETDKNPGKTSIQVIERMMILLDAFADHVDPVNLKALSVSTGLHPFTMRHTLNDMVTCHFVDRSDSGSYRLGIRLLELGNPVKMRLSVQEAALAPMRALHRLTGQTANLSVRQGDEIVCIGRACSEHSGTQVVCAIDGRVPLHLTSVGKLFLAADELGRVHVHATCTGLSSHTHTSITNLPRLEHELNWVRTSGYACDNEEPELGMYCIAAGIYNDSRRLAADLSLSAPADRLQDG